MLPFYVQHLDVDGFAIEASAQVSPYALEEAAWLVRRVVPRDDVRALAKAGLRLVIAGTGEMVTDLPEYNALTPKVWFDRRYRGMGPTDDAPVVLCPEEDLLALPGDPNPDESVCVHELAHAVELARSHRGPGFQKRMGRTYRHALASGLGTDTYSSQHASEYFAVGAAAWFRAPQPAGTGWGGLTREGLTAYDPALAALCRSVFGDGEWRYSNPWTREPTDRAHLDGFEPGRAIPFTWPERAQRDVPGRRLDWADKPVGASPPSEEATRLIFANPRQHGVDVGWIEFEGVRRPWFTMNSGEEVLHDAYAGHAWYVEQDGRELGQVVAGKGVGYIEIGPSPPPPIDGAMRAEWDLGAMRRPWVIHPPEASPASDEMTWLFLVNHRARDVHVEWLDFGGVRQPLQTLSPGEQMLRDAFVGHVWYFREQEGPEIGAIVVGPDVGYVGIE